MDDLLDVVCFSLSRKPVRGKNRSSAMSIRSFSLASVASSEEGEVSEYPNSKRSTLESNLGLNLADSADSEPE